MDRPYFQQIFLWLLGNRKTQFHKVTVQNRLRLLVQWNQEVLRNVEFLLRGTPSRLNVEQLHRTRDSVSRIFRTWLSQFIRNKSWSLVEAFEFSESFSIDLTFGTQSNRWCKNVFGPRIFSTYSLQNDEESKSIRKTCLLFWLIITLVLERSRWITPDEWSR